MGSEVVHSGGCHCRRVRWQLEAPASVVAWICNCSDCSMRGNIHFVVPAAKFTLQAGCDEFITTYTFGTHTAKHKFCRICGIASFYIPRSNPDGVAVTVACVDPGTMAHVEYRKADGRNWEKWFELSDISEFSKDAATVKQDMFCSRSEETYETAKDARLPYDLEGFQYGVPAIIHGFSNIRWLWNEFENSRQRSRPWQMKAKLAVRLAQTVILKDVMVYSISMR